MSLFGGSNSFNPDDICVDPGAKPWVAEVIRAPAPAPGPVVSFPIYLFLSRLLHKDFFLSVFLPPNHLSPVPGKHVHASL